MLDVKIHLFLLLNTLTIYICYITFVYYLDMLYQVCILQWKLVNKYSWVYTMPFSFRYQFLLDNSTAIKFYNIYSSIYGQK